jgi:hypothetical protein
VNDDTIALDFSVVAGYGQCSVRKLPEVEQAKALMIEGHR